MELSLEFKCLTHHIRDESAHMEGKKSPRPVSGGCKQKRIVLILISPLLSYHRDMGTLRRI